MEVNFRPETESRLQELAQQTGRASNDLIEDAMAWYLKDMCGARPRTRLATKKAAKDPKNFPASIFLNSSISYAFSIGGRGRPPHIDIDIRLPIPTGGNRGPRSLGFQHNSEGSLDLAHGSHLPP